MPRMTNHDAVAAITWCASLVLCACGRGDGSMADGRHGDVPLPQQPEMHRLTAESIARHGVETAPVETRALRRHVTAPARVEFAADRVSHIGCQLHGRVCAVPVALGSTVATGDPLLVVDSPELGDAQIELLQRIAALAAARPLVAFAEQDWQRAKALFAESQGVSQAEVVRREAELARATAAVRTAEVGVRAAEGRLRALGMQAGDIEALAHGGQVAPQLTIRAPFAGRIVGRDVTLGEVVGPSRDMLLTLADASVLWVMAEVPESRLADLATGADAEVWVANAGVRHRGTVTLIAPTVDVDTRTADVRIEVTGAGDALRPGMFVAARLTATPATGREAAVLCVPESAVQTIDGRAVVFVPVAGEVNAFVARPVEVGATVDGYVPIEAGLTSGERVVTAGSFVLKAQIVRGTGEGG